MTVTIIYGDRGSGKSALATYVGYHDEKQLMPNYRIRRDNVVPLTPANILAIDRPTHVIMDECYVEINSTASSSKKSRFWQYLLFQSRKRDIDITVVSQLPRRIDINFRELAEIIIEAQATGTKEHPSFHYRMVRVSATGPSPVVEFDINEELARTIFPLYDTDEIIGALDDDLLALVDKRTLIPQAEEIAKRLVAKYGHKMTKAAITHLLTDEGQGQTMIDMVYNCVQAMALPGQK